jgi:hypothetical protein
MTVYGLGRRDTPAPFVAACDRLIYLDLLSREPPEPAQPVSNDQDPAPRPLSLKRLLSTVIGSTSRDDGWSSLSEVGSYLSKSHAAFDPRDYGHTKLGELVRAEPYVEVKEVPDPGGLSQLWVRLKTAGPRRRRPTWRSADSVERRDVHAPPRSRPGPRWQTLALRSHPRLAPHQRPLNAESPPVGGLSAIRRSGGFRWQGDVHEKVSPSGCLRYLTQAA